MPAGCDRSRRRGTARWCLACGRSGSRRDRRPRLARPPDRRVETHHRSAGISSLPRNDPFRLLPARRRTSSYRGKRRSDSCRRSRAIAVAGVAIRGGQAGERGVGFIEDAEAGQRDGGGEVGSLRGIQCARKGLRVRVAKDEEARFGGGRRRRDDRALRRLRLDLPHQHASCRKRALWCPGRGGRGQHRTLDHRIERGIGDAHAIARCAGNGGPLERRPRRANRSGDRSHDAERGVGSCVPASPGARSTPADAASVSTCAVISRRPVANARATADRFDASKPSSPRISPFASNDTSPPASRSVSVAAARRPGARTGVAAGALPAPGRRSVSWRPPDATSESTGGRSRARDPEDEEGERGREGQHAAVRSGRARICRVVSRSDVGARGGACAFGGGVRARVGSSWLHGAAWRDSLLVRLRRLRCRLRLRSPDASPSRASTSARSAGSSASQLSITSRSAALARPATYASISLRARRPGLAGGLFQVAAKEALESIGGIRAVHDASPGRVGPAEESQAASEAFAGALAQVDHLTPRHAQPARDRDVVLRQFREQRGQLHG